jgi:hypothetical protein
MPTNTAALPEYAPRANMVIHRTETAAPAIFVKAPRKLLLEFSKGVPPVNAGSRTGAVRVVTSGVTLGG